MNMDFDLNAASDVASVMGLSTTFADWYRNIIASRKKKREKSEQVTIEHYKEWLRRKDHAEVLDGLERSHKVSETIANLIQGLSAQSRQAAEEMVNRVDRSNTRLELLSLQFANVQKQLHLFDHRVIRSQDEKIFEKQYLARIQSEFSRVRMVGLPEMRDVKQRFSVAYVSLNVKSSRGIELCSAEEALRSEPEMTIRGVAGSGKTTLMRWLALRCAQVSDADNLWKGGIPFIIPLRRLRGKDSRHPDMNKFVKYTVDPKLFPLEPPANWLRKVLDDKRAVVLVDGVDELPPKDRPYFWDWIDDFSDLCRGNRIYVTSRHISDEQWIPPTSFANAELDEMNNAEIIQFVRNWHDAIIDVGLDDKERKELEDARDSLPAKLRDSRNKRVRDLCRTPLLCSLVCALHWKEWGYLPSRRIDIYDRCCMMLIDERDRKREIGPPSGPLRYLECRDKEMLLQRLALDMMRNAISPKDTGQQIEVSRREAIKWLEPNIRSCDNSVARECTAKELLDHLIVRTGLLREPSKDRIDFPHRTFQEYLAACASGAMNQLGFLISQVHDDQWHETIILAAGTKVGGVTFGNALVEALLEKGEQSDDLALKTICFRLATACLETSHQLREDIRNRVLGHLPELLPPQNSEDAKILAAAGDAALPHLELKKWRLEKVNVVAACAQAVSSIGSPKAVSMLLNRGGYGNDRRSSVIVKVCECPGVEATDVPRIKTWMVTNEEIPMSVRPFFTNIDPFIASTEITLLDFTGFSGVADISAIKQCTKLKSLTLSGMASITDICPIAGSVFLQRLNISGCTGIRDFMPIAKLRSLSELNLSGLTQISDLSFLSKQKGMTDLTLIGIGAVDVSALSNLPFLRILDIRGCRELNGIEKLAGVRSIEEVIVDSHHVKRVTSIVGAEKVSRFRMHEDELRI